MDAELSPEEAKLLYTAVLEAQLAGNSRGAQALADLAEQPDKLHAIFEQADRQQEN